MSRKRARLGCLVMLATLAVIVGYGWYRATPAVADPPAPPRVAGDTFPRFAAIAAEAHRSVKNDQRMREVMSRTSRATDDDRDEFVVRVMPFVKRAASLVDTPSQPVWHEKTEDEEWGFRDLSFCLITATKRSVESNQLDLALDWLQLQFRLSKQASKGRPIGDIDLNGHYTEEATMVIADVLDKLTLRQLERLERICLNFDASAGAPIYGLMLQRDIDIHNLHKFAASDRAFAALENARQESILVADYYQRAMRRLERREAVGYDDDSRIVWSSAHSVRAGIASYFRRVARIRMLGCAAKVRVAKISTGVYPSGLGGIRATAMETDPYTGNRFLYKSRPDGFLIYSAYLDKRDNGGKFVFLATDAASGDLAVSSYHAQRSGDRTLQATWLH